MRYDYDLIRDILLFFESDDFKPTHKYSVETFIDEEAYPDNKDPFDDEPTPYEKEFFRVWKHLDAMINEGLIEGQELHLGRAGCSNYLFSMCLNNASGITMKGQYLLDQIRDDTQFNRFKTKIKELAIPFAASLAPNIIAKLLGC